MAADKPCPQLQPSLIIHGYNFLLGVASDSFSNQAHGRLHTKRKKYPCSYCDKSFKKYTHFKEHVRIHIGEKTYPCSYKDCEKTFKKSSHAKDHERTHTGEKTYSCIYCGKKYTQSPLIRTTA